MGRWTIALLATAVGLLALAPGAMARSVYVANSGAGTVSAIDSATNAVFATIPVGGEPVDVAISPDGTRAYVTDKANDSVVVLDTATNAQIGAVPVGDEPLGLAASPDGRRVYVANSGDASVSAIDTGANAVAGSPVPVGEKPDGVAISSDGTRLFVAQRGGNVSIVDTGSNAVVGTVLDALEPSRLAIGPRGDRAFVTDSAATSVTAFNPANGNVVGSPILVGTGPVGIAVEPSGHFAYAASPVSGTVTPFETSPGASSGAPIGGFPGATGIAIRPDGLRGYVTDGTGGAVSILDVSAGAAIGSIPVGAAPTGVAVVPNQGPQASLWVSPARKRATRALTFHGSGSKDPDGSIENYAWDFGDGGHVEGTLSTRSHRYRKPGRYLATLAVTDAEGCSNALVYTGQTASCNGSPAAIATSLIVVGDRAGPILRLAGGKRQRLRSRVSVRARCPRERCSLRAHGTLVASYEQDGDVRRHSVPLGKARVLRFSRGWRKLRLRVPGRARRAALKAISSGGEARAKLSVIARDLDDESRLRQRKVTLRP